MMNEMLTKEEVLNRISESAVWSKKYSELTEDIQQRFLDFCIGMRGLPLTYDPFFKKIFDPEQHPERLSRLLSLIIGKKVKVKRVLLNEGTRILEEGSLLIMDIVVELEDGSIANVEIQKIAYRFPGERAACYSSDLVMRQYSKVKKEKNKTFSYCHMKRVYTIVLLEKSGSEFKKIQNTYIHKSKQVFDSGLQLELLQQYIFVALDRFQEIKQNKIEEELDAWLHLISSDDSEILYCIMDKYPDFVEIYEEILIFRRDIGGVLSMFSEALRIMDQNTVQYMIDELQEELEKRNIELEIQQNELKAKEKRLEEREKRIQELEALLKEN